MNAVSNADMAAMLRDALAEADEPLPTEITSTVDWNKWGNLALVFVGGVAIGGFYVSTFCFEEFQPIGYGPAIVSMAPGIQNATTLFLDQYRQPELEKMSDRRNVKRRFQRPIQVETDNLVRI